MQDYPLTIRRGDTLQMNVSSLDSNDVPVDVTGYEAALTIWNSDVEVHRASTTTLEIVASGSGYAIEVSAAVTEDLPEYCWYELREKSPNGTVSTLLDGPFRVEAINREGEFVA